MKMFDINGNTISTNTPALRAKIKALQSGFKYTTNQPGPRGRYFMVPIGVKGNEIRFYEHEESELAKHCDLYGKESS